LDFFFKKQSYNLERPLGNPEAARFFSSHIESRFIYQLADFMRETEKRMVETDVGHKLVEQPCQLPLGNWLTGEVKSLNRYGRNGKRNRGTAMLKSTD
jgi:hypothetical protein